MKDALTLEAHLFAICLRYLTRLPMARDVAASDDLRIRATKYQPLVGALVGAVGALVLGLAGMVWSWPVAVLLSLGTTLLATGAFHEQGFARSAEALAIGSDRRSVLRGLQTSSYGRVGTLTLGLALALKLGLLMELPPGLAAIALIAAHGIGRMAAVHVVATTHYAREEGIRALVPGITPDGYRVALATSGVLLAGLVAATSLSAGLCAFLGAVALGQVWRMRAMAKMGGYTRDCLGGVEQLAELGVLLGLTVWV